MNKKLDKKTSTFDKRMMRRIEGVFWAIASDPAVLVGTFLISIGTISGIALISNKNQNDGNKSRQCVPVNQANGFKPVDLERLSLFNEATVRVR